MTGYCRGALGAARRDERRLGQRPETGLDRCAGPFEGNCENMNPFSRLREKVAAKPTDARGLDEVDSAGDPLPRAGERARKPCALS